MPLVDVVDGAAQSLGRWQTQEDGSVLVLQASGVRSEPSKFEEFEGFECSRSSRTKESLNFACKKLLFDLAKSSHLLRRIIFRLIGRGVRSYTLTYRRT